MPLLVLMARLCPAGAEGTTYALVTSVQMVSGATGPQQLHPSCHPHPPTTFPNLHATNLHKLGNLGSQVGGTVGGIFSQVATSAFGVTNTDFSALWRLTVLTSVGRLVSLAFLPLVPTSAASAGAQVAEGRRSAVAAIGILGLYVGGLVWALVQVGRAMV